MRVKLRFALLLATMLAAGSIMAVDVLARDRDRDDDDRCAGSRDLTLVNGRIHTMDARNSIVSSATIKNGRFVDAGRHGDSDDNGCTKIIDLRGRTAIPGLIDNHNHFVLLSIRPGHDTRLESAFSIADVQAAIRARAAGLPPGAWITAIGGWIPAQFAENRLPTLAELDAAAPNNPVLVFQQFTGPSTTNSLGKAFFGGKGITVSATGAIDGTGSSIKALDALRAIQTFDDQKQGTLDAMAYSAKLGVTTNVDMGGFIIPGLPNIEDSFVFDTSASWDPFAAYDSFLALHQQGKLSVRLRIFFLTMDQNADIPMTTQRVLNAFVHFGDDMMRVSGMGEFVTAWPLFGGAFPTNYGTALQLVAERGWPFQQHTLSSNEDTFILQTFQTVNATTPIANLRWSIAHVPHITQANIDLAKSLGVGIAVHPFEYLSGATAPNAGPPFRTILDSGARMGAGSDSAQISTLNPWNMIYYMVTGINVGGHLVNAGQLLTRTEAIRAYTAANGWFFKEEDKLGSIEEGKLGDVVVLSDDFFDTKKVPDSAIRKLHSVLTVVNGKVVYDELHH